MTHLIKKFISSEVEYFNKLNKQGKQLITSYTLSGLSEPFFYTFIGAFLLRNSHDPVFLAVYFSATFIGLPAAFYVNGLLLRYYSTTFLYMLGCLLQAVLIVGLVFFFHPSYASTILFGLLFGMAAGIYWGNRNFMTLRLTHTDNRIYFSALESASGAIIGITVPFIVGWFIVLGGYFGWYSPDFAYKILAFLSASILLAAGYILYKMNLPRELVGNMILKRASKKWNLFRLFTLLSGIEEGSWYVLPTIIIFQLVGREGSIGTIQSSAEIIASFAIYYLSKKVNTTHRVRIFFVYVLLSFIGTLFFGLTYSILGVLVLFACSYFGSPFSWISANSFSMDAIDSEEKNRDEAHYAFVFDTELFLNIGRFIGVAIFFILTFIFSQKFSIRWTLFIETLSLLCIIPIFKYLNDQLHEK